MKWYRGLQVKRGQARSYRKTTLARPMTLVPAAPDGARSRMSLTSSVVASRIGRRRFASPCGWRQISPCSSCWTRHPGCSPAGRTSRICSPQCGSHDRPEPGCFSLSAARRCPSWSRCSVLREGCIDGQAWSVAFTPGGLLLRYVLDILSEDLDWRGGYERVLGALGAGTRPRSRIASRAQQRIDYTLDRLRRAGYVRAVRLHGSPVTADPLYEITDRTWRSGSRCCARTPILSRAVRATPCSSESGNLELALWSRGGGSPDLSGEGPVRWFTCEDMV